MPNKPPSIIIIISLTRGEAIRKENVIPRGIPASRKLMNKGTAEQEQNGVNTPKPPATRFALNTGIAISRSRVLSTGNHDLISAIMKTIRASRRNILRHVAIKKISDCPRLPDAEREKMSMTMNRAALSLK